ncbi:Bifunctional hydroxy-methylpyrimidine kinase/ hydroxy-phosphomethylpyrimidine kinase [Sodalis praecaptivus]|uniref:hydroxymethylpyrimidine kinase n=1 Tax=Sodalis praecaptivus TaxID=1239307 RepID=W0HQW9_9GAMM|nr:bifunctional hydroxymethylpyrimidine kinase/phosphomethylpyrimidine kinase [Sodalis praecaptivus]AHF76246.1 Bifunctional hydroxy-methylpyrimidine kinase/ hydroxy-phosphomethylpyrimidine kinase [Sodalis praecaptivus]
MSRIYYALSIAGTDPSGGAGIQADLKTFSALGAYGTTVVTSLVAQNTRGVQSVYPIDAAFVAEQMESVLSDVRIDSAKIGMLGQASVIRAVAAKLQKYPIPWLVLDTVMVAKSGDALLDEDAVTSLRDILLPLASIITPNLPEAAVLLGCAPAVDEHQMRQQGRALLALGCQAVVMKGGHLAGGASPDWLISPEYELRFDSARVATRHTHGTGCTLSAALAALRPRYDDWPQTLRAAKAWLQQALLHADDLRVGQGIGPVHHFHEWW